MLSKQIPYLNDIHKSDFVLNDLLRRVALRQRAYWADLYKGSGVYVVYHSKPQIMNFSPTAGMSNTRCKDPLFLKERWLKINKNTPTDIVYIGKGNVKNRVRSLVRFGLGRAMNHGGGEWMWQIKDISYLNLLVSSCPDGKQAGYEKYLLNKFFNEHGFWPIANRNGGTGEELWSPIVV